MEFGEGEGKIPVGKIVEKAEDYYLKVIRATTRNPRSVKNTIKRKFLEECKSKGVFDVTID